MTDLGEPGHKLRLWSSRINKAKYQRDESLARRLAISALETRNRLPLRALSAMEPAQLPAGANQDEDVFAGVSVSRQISPVPEQTANAVPALAEDLIARMVGQMVPVSPDLLRATEPAMCSEASAKPCVGPRSFIGCLGEGFCIFILLVCDPTSNKEVNLCLS